MEQLQGMEPSPDVEMLSAALVNIPENKARRLMGTSWKCINCKELYAPTKNYLANLPHFKCSSCNIQNYTSYFWSMVKCLLNDVSLDFPIYTQGDGQCVLFALFALCDLARRVRAGRHGLTESYPFSEKFMLMYYEQFTGYTLVDGPEGGEDYYVYENMLSTAYRFGIPYEKTGYDRQLHIPPGVCRRHLKIKSWFRIKTKNTEEITRLLANGIPLIGTVNDGKLFSYLGAGEIYHAPVSSDTAHAVVLHSSGMSVGKGDGTHGTYYGCRNSHGDRAHPSYEKEGRGGDFNVWAADLVGPYVYGVILADDDDFDLVSLSVSEVDHSNDAIRTLRFKPVAGRVEEVERFVEKLGQIARQKLLDEMGTEALDLEFQTRQEAEFVMEVSSFGPDSLPKPKWAPHNLSWFRKNAGSTKVEYEETKPDEMGTADEEKESTDWENEDDDYGM